MALVAVVCCLATVLPWIFTIAATAASATLFVAIAAFLIAGVVSAKGDRRLFAIAALGCFLVSFWAQRTGWVIVQLLDEHGLSGKVAVLIWAIVAPLEHAALALLGGWIAVRSQQFWKQEMPRFSEPNAPPTRDITEV
jgi:hypothetical protein